MLPLVKVHLFVLKIELELLTCRYCHAPLKAIPLDTDENTGDQRFFWACRNMKTKTCYFPLGLPNKVFWLKRTAEQREMDFFPRPAIHLLPREFRPLYPTVFSEEGSRKLPPSRSETSATSVANESFSGSASTQSPGTSTSSVSTEIATTEASVISEQNKGAAVLLIETPLRLMRQVVTTLTMRPLLK
ncbi:unnamed protein product [Strongylus vulgaris]|uniref:Zinc finger GRF-type domain-containing protein n=1 Tax=Strongylus vulgaris TaxID=40348 RepID=A0A3P7ITR3_STRVU|nr:unnamed protein product [Strongylus vulgaris]